MAVLGFPGVACMRCIRYFSSDYHQKWARTLLFCQTTSNTVVSFPLTFLA